MPRYLVRHFHVLHFHVLHFHVLHFHVFHFHVLHFQPLRFRWSVIFMPRDFDGPSFSRPAFSVDPYNIVIHNNCDSFFIQRVINNLAVFLIGVRQQRRVDCVWIYSYASYHNISSWILLQDIPSWSLRACPHLHTDSHFSSINRMQYGEYQLKDYHRFFSAVPLLGSLRQYSLLRLMNFLWKIGFQLKQCALHLEQSK